MANKANLIPFLPGGGGFIALSEIVTTPCCFRVSDAKWKESPESQYQEDHKYRYFLQKFMLSENKIYLQVSLQDLKRHWSHP